MKRTTMVVGNWKMNPETLAEAKSIFRAVLSKIKNGPRVVIAPPAVFISSLASLYKGKKVSFSAQDISFEGGGAFTGEIGAKMLKSAGVSYSIIGHSERRTRGESDDIVRKKVRACLDAKINPIVCVGEKSRDQDGAYLEELKLQIEASLGGVLPEEIGKVIIAYEPVWAVGVRAMGAIESKDLYTISLFISKTLYDIYQSKSKGVIVLYGGSVNKDNARDLVLGGNMQGLLVGRESLNPENFALIVKSLK